jgi:acetyltransferase-like isoleucine patch superfamily enzyme
MLSSLRTSGTLLDVLLRLKPALVHDLRKGSLKVVFVPWSSTLRGPVYFGSKVRLLRGSSIDARGGSIHVGDSSVICRFANLEAAGGMIRIGNRSSVGDFSSVYGQGGAKIGDDVLLASGVRIVPSSHTFSDRSKPISQQGMSYKGIFIENGVWVGTNSVILDGVSIGTGSVIGSGAVVNKSIPEFSIAVGVPAKVIRVII